MYRKEKLNVDDCQFSAPYKPRNIRIRFICLVRYYWRTTERFNNQTPKNKYEK